MTVRDLVCWVIVVGYFVLAGLDASAREGKSMTTALLLGVLNAVFFLWK